MEAHVREAHGGEADSWMLEQADDSRQAAVMGCPETREHPLSSLQASTR